MFKFYASGVLTWFRNVSFHLHPLVCGYSLLGLGWIVTIGPVQVVRAPQLTEVVGVESVRLAWV